MPDGLKKAAAWLGLVSDDRYTEDERHGRDEVEYTDEVYVDDEGDEDEQAERGSNVAPVNRWQQSSQEIAPRQGTTVVQAQTHSIRRAEPPLASSLQQRAVASSQPESQQTADISRIITVKPRTYNEARTIGEHYRDGVPVIMNLSEMEDVDAKRLVDFAAGLVFGLRGTIERVTSKVFLLSPHNVSVAAEDKERLAGSFFNQS